VPEKKTRKLNSESMQKRNINIGNLLYSVSTGDGMSVDSLGSFISDADCGPQAADCRMELINYEPRTHNRRSGFMNNRLFEADQTWGLYNGKKKNSNQQTVMTVPAMKSGRHSRVIAEFDNDFRNGTVYTRKTEEHYFFYPFLEVLTINLLAGGKGSLLHACCINDNGSGYLFLGQSGAGKSTMANLWNEEKGITILSDDRVLVSMTGQGLTAYGTPWHGTEKYAVNASVPVKKIFFISHSDKNSALEVNGITSVSELVRNAFLPFWDRDRMQYSTEFLIQLSQNARLFRLGVHPDRKIIDLIRNI
jgi:hypothetical protein